MAAIVRMVRNNGGGDLPRHAPLWGPQRQTVTYLNVWYSVAYCNIQAVTYCHI
jgi:hypothetical protein